MKCRAQCSLINGYCTVPDTCICRDGWGGNICTTPLCPRGCINGNCNSPDMCTCLKGWSSVNCSVADCPDSVCNKDNGACNTPNVCTCNAGWTGDDCSEAICSPECVNGACIRPNTCFCANRWNGSTCNMSICSSGCVNGMCTQPDVCTCDSGWTGTSCETEIVTDTGGSSLSGSGIYYIRMHFQFYLISFSYKIKYTTHQSNGSCSPSDEFSPMIKTNTSSRNVTISDLIGNSCYLFGVRGCTVNGYGL